MNKLIVISGCSGGGKSSLLSALNSAGYFTVAEAGRQIVNEQLKINGNMTPWDRLIEFYAGCGYKALEIPKMSVQERLQFVVSTL